MRHSGKLASIAVVFALVFCASYLALGFGVTVAHADPGPKNKKPKGGDDPPSQPSPPSPPSPFSSTTGSTIAPDPAANLPWYCFTPWQGFYDACKIDFPQD